MPLLLPNHSLKNWKTKTSNFNKDHETKIWHIFWWKCSPLIFISNTIFFNTNHCQMQQIHGNQDPKFFYSSAFAWCINKKLTWQDKLALVKKHTPIPVEIINGWSFSLRLVTHETKALQVTIGSPINKVVFNVISSSKKLCHKWIIVAYSMSGLTYNKYSLWNTKTWSPKMWNLHHNV